MLLERQPIGADQSMLAAVASMYVGERYASRISKRLDPCSPETGFDCSGFVSYVLRRSGIQLPMDLGRAPRTVFQLYNATNEGRTSLGDQERGDIVFFYSRNQLSSSSRDICSRPRGDNGFP